MGVRVCHLGSRVPLVNLPDEVSTPEAIVQICLSLGQRATISPDAQVVHVDSPVAETVMVLVPSHATCGHTGEAGVWSPESEGVLALSGLLAGQLRAAGAIVYLARPDANSSAKDVEDLIKSVQPDVVVGLHTGFLAHRRRPGLGAYHSWAGGNRSRTLAQDIVRSLSACTGLSNHGHHFLWRGAKSDPHLALFRGRIPSVLVHLTSHRQWGPQTQAWPADLLERYASGLWLGIALACARWQGKPAVLPPEVLAQCLPILATAAAAGSPPVVRPQVYRAQQPVPEARFQVVTDTELPPLPAPAKAATNSERALEAGAERLLDWMQTGMDPLEELARMDPRQLQSKTLGTVAARHLARLAERTQRRSD